MAFSDPYYIKEELCIINTRLWPLYSQQAASLHRLKIKKVWISIGADAQQTALSSGAQPLLAQSVAHNGRAWIGEVSESELAALSHEMHENHHRCGGYIVHSSAQSAMAASNMPLSRASFVAQRSASKR